MVFLNTTHLWRNVFTSSLTCVKKPNFFFCTEVNFLLLLIKCNTSSAEMIMQQEFLNLIFSPRYMYIAVHKEMLWSRFCWFGSLNWARQRGHLTVEAWFFSVYLHCHWTGDGSISCWEFFFKVLLHVGFVARSSSHDAFMCCKAMVKAKMIWEEPDLYLGALLIFNQYLLEYMCSWTKIRQSNKIFDWRCTLQYWCWEIWSSTFMWNVKVRVLF